MVDCAELYRAVERLAVACGYRARPPNPKQIDAATPLGFTWSPERLPHRVGDRGQGADEQDVGRLDDVRRQRLLLELLGHGRGLQAVVL